MLRHGAQAAHLTNQRNRSFLLLQDRQPYSRSFSFHADLSRLC